MNWLSEMDTLKLNLESLIKKSVESKLSLDLLESVKKQNQYFSIKLKYKLLLVASVVFYIGNLALNSGQCLMPMPRDLGKVFRPEEKCDFCANVISVNRVSNLSPGEFENEYAYSGKPVVITDATKNWTATEVFSYHFFKDLYLKEDPHRETLKCQFFPYKTNLRNLFNAFEMEEDRVKQKAGFEPWYFGWSNCNEHIASKLREHYDRPYFLPKASRLHSTDWIFIGGRGQGAHMHVDNVRLSSWQAQIKGTKEWVIGPPPECLYQCKFFSIIVNPGDIIIVDTNRWYHKTNVLSDEISVVIGAEFD